MDTVDIHVGLESHFTRGDGEFEGRQATQQTGAAGTHLDACRLRPETLVDAVAEAELTVGLAADVQGIRVLEAMRVTVGCRQGDNDG